MLNLAAIKVGAMRYNSPWTQVCLGRSHVPIVGLLTPGRYSRFRNILFRWYVFGPRWSRCRVSQTT
jgi:hypothetical protein